MAQIFLCHASEDKARVRDVYQRLKVIKGFEPWLDEEDLLPGQDWAREIPRALQTSDFILIFFSRTSVAKRGYVQREMKLALDALQELPEGSIFAIPVRLDDCQVPEQFRRYHYANLFDPRGFERLVRAIHLGWSQRQPSEVPRPLPPTLTNSISMEFVLMAAGEFWMGSNDGNFDEKPVHKVRISQPFYLGMYEVTQGQWEAVMGTNLSAFAGDLNRPVETVSWDDVQEFMRRLNAKEGDMRYRLPTEAEWEYACRAGSTTRYSFGDDSRQLSEYGWYGDNSGNTTHPVGQRKPNAWGLYDIYGNVWEWVQNWYGAYTSEPVTDPQGPASGSNRVVRGGSWGDGAGGCRSAYRGYGAPGHRNGNRGFRLLRTAL